MGLWLTPARHWPTGLARRVLAASPALPDGSVWQQPGGLTGEMPELQPPTAAPHSPKQNGVFGFCFGVATLTCRAS